MLVIIREEANTKVLCEFFTISWGRAVATLAVLAILYSFCLLTSLCTGRVPGLGLGHAAAAFCPCALGQL